MASMDTMGQASAMTGGYGNSWAQNAGQQAYQGYLQQLNEVVPELYGMAYDRYQQEGQALLNQYGMVAAQDEQDYGRYRDQVGDYFDQMDRATEEARYKEQMDYEKWMEDNSQQIQQEAAAEGYTMSRADTEYWNEMWAGAETEADADYLWNLMLANGVPDEVIAIFYEKIFGKANPDVPQGNTEVAPSNPKKGSNGGGKPALRVDLQG